MLEERSEWELAVFGEWSGKEGHCFQQQPMVTISYHRCVTKASSGVAIYHFTSEPFASAKEQIL